MTDCTRIRAAMLALALPVAGCAEVEEDASSADVTLIDHREALTSSEINFINGTYTNCTSRTGNWSLAVTGTPTLDYTALSVIKGDTACTLAISGVNTSGDGLLAASSAISLGTSYGTARSFGNPIKYYANAMLSVANFSSNFTLTLLFSDDPRTATGSNTASYAIATATASAQGVTAPNYTLDLTGVTVTTDINKVVQSVTGNLALSAGSATGDYYVLVSGSVADTYAAINTAYAAGSKVAMSTSIAASGALANGVDLTSSVVRSVIIGKTTNGVTSYQKFAITFNGPP
ncbi:MAG: hypothetical protein JWN48_5380 [Myxococcaceae bacterium]|nr:hypothetical protein [Myxococcaceae bacterium]